MHYTMLLWPHANARYQVETEKLARAELEVMLSRLGMEYTWEEGGVAGLPSLDFSARPLADAEATVISRHSLLYALFERREDGALLPLLGREAPRVGGEEERPWLLFYTDVSVGPDMWGLTPYYDKDSVVVVEKE